MNLAPSLLAFPLVGLTTTPFGGEVRKDGGDWEGGRFGVVIIPSWATNKQSFLAAEKGKRGATGTKSICCAQEPKNTVPYKKAVAK